MEYILKAMLITSCTGSLLAAALRLAQPLTKRFFSAAWHYYIWVAVLLVTVIPVKFSLPQRIFPTSAPVQVQTDDTVPPDMPQTAQPDIPHAQLEYQPPRRSHRGIIPQIWFYTALALFCIRCAQYAAFLRKVHANTHTDYSIDITRYTKRRLAVRRGNTISPCIVGIIRPMLILPERDLSAEQLDSILRHELTHLNRGDICIKWLCVSVKCLHWFNPAVYYIAAKINTECEISCDMRALRGMNRSDELNYVNTILALLSPEGFKSNPLTTGMTGSKKTLKRRFNMIKNRKNISHTAKLASAAFAVCAVSAAVFCGGAFAGELLPHKYTIEISSGSGSIDYSTRPFTDNGVLYLPLRETLEKSGVNRSVGFENGVITVSELGRRVNPILNEFRTLEAELEPGSRWFTVTASNSDRSESYRLQGEVILRGGVTYVPFDFFGNFSDFAAISASVTDADGNDVYLRDRTYTNTDMNFSLEMPISWRGRYVVSEYDGIVIFNERSAYENYAPSAGELFSIIKTDGHITQEDLDSEPPQEPVTRRVLMYNDGTYILTVPTDIQFGGGDEQTFAEHARLSPAINDIADSIQPLVRIAE